MKKSELSLLEHLEELRRRLFICVIFVAVGTVAGFAFVERIRKLLIRPAGELSLIYVNPPEALVANIRLAFIAGIILALPLILYQVLAFIFPALYKNEKKIIIPIVFFMLIFFAGGVSFAYFTVFPFAITFFLNFAGEDLAAMFTITNYLSFATSLLFAFGLVFQTPLLFYVLGKLNIVSAKFLRRNRKYAVLIIVILSAVITPPDVVTQIMLAIPLIFLYELGVILVVISQRGRKDVPDIDTIE